MRITFSSFNAIDTLIISVQKSRLKYRFSFS